MPIRLISQIIYRYPHQIIAVIVLFFAYHFVYDYFIPEYCITDNFENRAAVKAYGFELSDTQKSENKICFRSNDQQLVQQMIQEMHDKQLEKEFELQLIKEENNNKLLTTLLEPHYFYSILIVILILGISYIESNKRR